MRKPELLEAQNSVVVVVDLQGKLMQMIHRPRLVIDSTIRLMKIADLFKVPVILTEQYPRGLGPTHPQVRSAFDALDTETKFLEKVAFGCCGDAGFNAALAQARPDVAAEDLQVVVAGIEAHVCIMQTVLKMLEANHSVHLCWECISGRGEEYRRHAIERMAQAGAVVTNHESVGFEWARDKDHPQFKAMSNLFKEGQFT